MAPITNSTEEWEPIRQIYAQLPQRLKVLDVFSQEHYELPVEKLIEFQPKSDDFILSVPHSGTFVPEEFAERFELDEKCLVEIDLFSDMIYEIPEGLHVICRLAPFFVDMNRSREGADEPHLPKHLQNPPQEYYTIENKTLLKESHPPQDEMRVLKYYDVYHQILSQLIEQMRSERGYALMIDGHSMTSVGLGRVYDEGQERANFVVGTLDDTSADHAIITAFVDTLNSEAKPHGLSLTVAKDVPYAGGFITRKHRNPEQHVHALQVEVTMNTYMYEAVDENLEKRYALKQTRVNIVREILRHAIGAASDTAKRVYQ